MESPKPATSSSLKEKNERETEIRNTPLSSLTPSSTPSLQIDPKLPSSPASHCLSSDPVLSSYSLFHSKRFAKPTSDSDDDSLDGTPKYGQKRSDTLPNSYFSGFPNFGWDNSDLYLDSYSSEEERKEKLKVHGKGKSLLKKNVTKSSKKIPSDDRIKDSILSSFAETCYKCKICKITPAYMSSVESFIFHMKNQHSDIYKELLLKSSVTNGNCSQGNGAMRHDGSSSDEGIGNQAARITSEHLLKYSKLWQNSPKSSATDPKPLEESKPKISNLDQIQKVTDQFLKSSATISLSNCQPKSPNMLTNNASKIPNGIQSPNPPSSTLSKIIPAISKNSTSNSNMPPKNEKNTWKGDLPPSFTPEFGRYTKLVREGGNIVYFCQVCNWKCQVKAAFMVHCNGLQHHNKVRVADQNNVEKCKQKTEPNNVEAAIRKAIDYSNNLQKQQAATTSSSSNSSVKLPIIKVPNFNKTINSSSHQAQPEPNKSIPKKDNPLEKEKPVSDVEKPEIRNKRKRPFPVRKSSNDGDDWADSESEDEIEIKKSRCEETFFASNDEEIIKTKSQMLGSCPSMVPMEDYFSRYSAQNYRHIPSLAGLENKSEKPRMDQNEVSDKEPCLPIFPTGYTGLLPESRDDNSDIQYRCTFCNVFCTGLSDYKDHFKMEHDIESPDLTMADGKGGQNNEWWKMMKIKETLSDLLINSPKGNVSRDLLLHKVSLTLNMPEVTRWGPSCNKAVREEFPHSMAQRKGKFKKTYFFGVALVDQVQEQEELSDSEMSYQPLRDMSHDLERILEHLPALIKWTGNLSTGISRDDVLELLSQKIEEREVIHWGVQCNRAVRMLFPDVQMKRKGKYKTVFYGVDYVDKPDKPLLTKDDDKEDSLSLHYRDDDNRSSPYSSLSNPLLGYNPLAAQHNELAMQYQTQLFNMWRFMTPFHHFPMHPNMDMMGMGGNSLSKEEHSISSASSPEHRDTESPVLSVGSKSDLDQFIAGNSKSPAESEGTGQAVTHCSVEERKESNGIISQSPVPAVSS